MSHDCPVCGYDSLPRAAEDFVICPSCGTEFGYHDAKATHDELRAEWLKGGAQWHSSVIPRPKNWDALKQLHAYFQREQATSTWNHRPEGVVFHVNKELSADLVAPLRVAA